MRNAIALLTLSLMSASCINLEGRLNVKEPMTVKKRGGFLNLQIKSTQIQPGNYQASLKVNSAKSFTLKLGDILIPLKSQNDFSIPANGNVIIRGRDIAQPFDVSGKIETTVTESDLTRTYEDCTIQRTENQCERVCTGGTPTMPYHCDVVCRDVFVSYEGSRYVEYHYKYTSRELTADLLDSSSKAVKASFSGYDNEADRINDYYGVCR